MRFQHYFFAHRLLPTLLLNGHSLLGILANPENQEFLREEWEAAYQEVKDRPRPSADLFSDNAADETEGGSEKPLPPKA